jgi:signal transduction histidine kinase/CheY-like chemotaxis protein
LKHDEFGIHPLKAIIRDRETERAFLDARRADDARATALALLLGGLAYAMAGLTDGPIFSALPDTLFWVRILRALGVVLCLGSGLLVWRLRTTRAVHALSMLAMLGTLGTYSVIAFWEETLVGASDFRLVFSVFSLLAFIFFPIRVVYSAAMTLWMMVNVSLLFGAIGRSDAVEPQRTLALMGTFAVAGASFSIANHRSRRKEFVLRQRSEQASAEVSREVEQRRAVERELAAYQQNLERTVAERTEELHRSQRDLVASQRMEAIGQLAGGLAHDFNNLLVVVSGNAELALRVEGLPEEARAYQHEILDAARRASSLSRDLLTFSRRQVMEFQSLDLGDVVDHLAGLLRMAVGTGARLEVKVGAGTPPVRGSRGPLEQVVLNLVLNARDATGPGGEIVVETGHALVTAAEAGPEEKAGHYALLSVSDTGTGIASDALERIFEPFFSTKPESKGTGLGLSVVHGVVRQHDGFIRVSSQIGRGTRFDVYLPASSGPVAAVAASLPEAARGGKEGILVVDDEDAVLRLATRTLQQAGYRVFAAAGANEALALFRERRSEIDLVLSDLVMPKVSGRELMQEIRKLGSDVPFLFSSGYSDGGVHRGFVLDEGIRLLTKPYQLDELKRKVREALG